MPRLGNFQTQRINLNILNALKARMVKDHRMGSVNAFIEEILEKYCSGILKDWNIEGPRLELELRSRMNGKTVYSVGPARAIMEDDERKREAS